MQQSDGYMKYIATRPRAERLGDHGLFGDEDGVDLEQAMEELDQYTGNVWTHIISLKREDAARLGYDNAKAWRNLLRANRNDIAAAMNIHPNHFRWYAAFHDEGKHPHVHMMAWSTVPGEAYLTRDGIRKIKSKLTNQIFRQEMLHTYEQKSQSRDELVREARRAIRSSRRRCTEHLCDHPEVEQNMEQLAGQLETVKGKKSYGYLPKPVKKTVDEIVDKLEELPVVRQCYDQWCVLQGEVDELLPRQAQRAEKAVPGERVPADQKRRHPGGGAHPAGRDHLRGRWTWASGTSRSSAEMSPMPAGSCGRSSGTKTYAGGPDAAADGAGAAGGARRPLCPIPAGAALPGRPSADPRQLEGRVLVHPGGQSRGCRRLSTPWPNCSSLTIWRCGTRTRASAG